MHYLIRVESNQLDKYLAVAVSCTYNDILACRSRGKASVSLSMKTVI